MLAARTVFSDLTNSAETDTPANVAFYAALDDPAEEAWQAQAIAEVLLDPDWPPWREDAPEPST